MPRGFTAPVAPRKPTSSELFKPPPDPKGHTLTFKKERAAQAAAAEKEFNPKTHCLMRIVPGIGRVCHVDGRRRFFAGMWYAIPHQDAARLSLETLHDLVLGRKQDLNHRVFEFVKDPQAAIDLDRARAEEAERVAMEAAALADGAGFSEGSRVPGSALNPRAVDDFKAMDAKD